MVLVTACHAASPREGIDFLPLTVDYRENTYASGRIPGGFFKREGKPPEKEVLTSRLIDRPIRPLFPSGWRYETQVVALVISADTENDSDVLALTGAGAALAISEIPFAKPIAGVRIGLVDGTFLVNPTYDQRRKSRLDLIVAGTADAIVMVEAGAKEVSEDEMVIALDTAHKAIKDIIAGTTDARRQGQQAEAEGLEARDRPRLLPRSRDQGARPAGRCHAHPGQAGELQHRRLGAEEPRRLVPRGRGPAARRRQADLQGSQGEGAARRDPRARQAPRRPQVRRDPPDLERGRRPPPRPRLDRVHARRDAGARHLHPRHRRRPAEGRGRRRRDLQALHAALQLPAVLGRGGVVPARPRPARDRPRRARRARAGADDADRGAVPLHRPRRLGHPRVERLVVDGLGLRRLDGDDGRRRAARGSGRRHGHGPGDERGERQVRRPLRHRRRRGPLRRHGLQGRRHGQGHHRPADGHQGRRHHHGDHAPGPGAGPPGPAVHPRQDGRDAGDVRARTSRCTRRASSRSRSRSTRSATSSGRAAR